MSPTGLQRDDLPVIDTDILVVGAGPTGLMAALVLASCGIPTVAVDHKAGPTRESRALAVQARTMEIYDQLGLADQVLAAANTPMGFQIGNTSVDALRIDELQEGATPFPGIQIFEQSHNEELLYSALTARGADVHWGHRLIDVVDQTAEPDGRVVALLEGDNGLVRVRAQWCIGADGAGSTVRRALDLRFDGTTDESTFWVADLHDVQGLPENYLAIKFGESIFAMAFPLGPGGHTRLLALAPHDKITQDEAIGSAASELNLTIGRIDWFSTYRVHHRVASKFRVGSVFLAGDAGHVHSPVGGQGMNTGLQDAHNLALLLADVAQSRAEVEALDRYESERRPVAVTLVGVTDRAFGLIASRNRSVAFLRNHASRLVGSIAPLAAGTKIGRRLGGYIGQYRIRYRFLAKDAPVPAWADDPAVGLRLSPVADNHELLRSMTWQLHAYGTGDIAPPDVPAWIDGPHVLPPDPDKRLKSNRLYLVRPDGFIAASVPLRGSVANEDHLRASLKAHHLIV